MKHLSPPSSHIHGFRRDVEGLRAIAVVMVLLYHLEIGWATGGFAGVDVFFVISGFLITGLLAKEVAKTGRVSLLDFYARRAKRLFPAAALVLAATAALTVWLLPRTRWQDIGGDIVASAAYFINWRLASRSIDYLAEDAVPSPVQHFWSLAVEEQYYIVWPLLLVAVLWLFRSRIKPTTLLLGVTAAVGIPSLVYSILHTTSSPATAYFITTTRMWELAIGAAIALLAQPLGRMHPLFARALGWAGVAGLAVTLLLVSRETAWPSYAAALPTLCTAAVIAAGFAAGPQGPVALLGTRAMCWIGGISYSLYLWHWPLIQFAKAHWGATLPVSVTAGVVAASVVLAWMTLRWVENPIRFSERMRDNPRYALSTGINFSLAGVVFGLGVLVAVGAAPGQTPATTTQAGTTTEATDAPLGALALTQDGPDDPALLPTDTAARIVPAPERATADVPRAYGDGCQLPYSESTPKACYYGREKGRLTIAVVGDSKAVQWIPALEILAERHDWRILVHAKSACGFHSRPLKQFDGKPYVSCTEWNQAVVPLLLGEQKPDVIFTSMGSGSGGIDATEVAALRERWGLMARAGIKVVAMANNPSPGINVYECVGQNPTKLGACAFPRRPASATASMGAAAAEVPGVHYVDLNDSICARTVCSAVIGDVLVYRQGSHITRTYAETLAPRLEQALETVGILATSIEPLLKQGQAASMPRGMPPPAPILPEGIQLPFQHTVYKDRRGDTNKDAGKRWIHIEYMGAAAPTLAALDGQLVMRGYVAGQRRDAEGELRINYRRRQDGARLAVVVAPGKDGNGKLYLTFVDGAPKTSP